MGSSAAWHGRCIRATPSGKRSSRLGNLGSSLADLVGGEEMIGPRVADRVEEAGAAVDMAPPLGMMALGIGAHIEKGVPVLVAQIRRLRWPIDMRLAAVAELQFRPFPAIWAVDAEQMRPHQN